MSPCKSHAKISNNSVSPSGERIWASVFVYRRLIANTILAGIPYAISISISFPLCIVSTGFLKSTKVNIAGR